MCKGLQGQQAVVLKQSDAAFTVTVSLNIRYCLWGRVHTHTPKAAAHKEHLKKTS